MSYQEMQERAYKYEMAKWSLTISLKYMSGPWGKFIFNDEEQARTVYEAFTKALADEKNYRLNDRERTFTFESANKASTTVDLSEVSAISINAPFDYIYADAA